MAGHDFRMRFLHAMVRVADLDRALAFWVGELGMREFRRVPLVDQRCTFVYLGYGADEPQLELCHDWSRPSHATDPLLAAGAAPDERGARVVSLHAAAPGRRAAAFHVGIGVDRIHEFVARLRARGVKVLRDPAPLRPGGRIVALVEDPEGNEVELLG